MISDKNSQLSIIGENIILNKNGGASALFMMPGFNYSCKKVEVIDAHINRLYDVFNSLSKNNPHLSFCIGTLEIPITKNETTEIIKNVASKWTDKDITINDRVKNGCYHVITLEIFLDDENVVQSLDFMDIVKSYVSDFFSAISPYSTRNYDRLFNIEKDYNIILSSNNIERATKDITFRYIVKQIFPGYSFPINMKNIQYNIILKNIYQFYQFKMGYFVTKNDYVSLFNLKPKDVYSSIVGYEDFLQVNDTNKFDISGDNVKIFVRLCDKESIRLKLKRQSSDIGFEVETAVESDENNDVNSDISKMQLINKVLARLDKECACEGRVVKIISAESKEDLDKRKKELTVNMLNKQVSIIPFLNQKDAYFDYFINRRPRKYNLMSDFRYLLASKIDNFTIVGDFDVNGGFSSKIGEVL